MKSLDDRSAANSTPRINSLKMAKTMRKAVAVTTQRKDAPPWMQEDRYIKTGYRLPLGSVHGCALSLLYLHNEWVNAWSHLLPGMVHSLLLAKECRDFSKQWNTERYVDQMMVWQYIVSCILCLLFSASPRLQYYLG